MITADLHLAPTTWKDHPQLKGDAYYALAQIVAKTLMYRVPLFLLGDIFDTQRPDSESVRQFCAQMNRLQNDPHDVYFVDGNHDFADPSWPTVHDWPQYLPAEPVTIHGHKIIGLDYTPRGELADKLAAVPADTSILMTHQAWDELMRIGKTDGSFSQVHHARYLLTGDFHVCCSWVGQSATGALKVWSPGSTCLQELGESLPKYCLLLVDDNGVLDVEALPLVSRPYAKYRLQTEADLIHLMANLPPAHPAEIQTPEAVSFLGPFPRGILRVRYSDDIPHAYQRLMTLNEHYHLFLEPVRAGEVEQISVEMSTPATISNQDTLESVLGEMQQGQQPLPQHVFDGAVRLLRSQDPAATINEMFDAPPQV